MDAHGLVLVIVLDVSQQVHVGLLAGAVGPHLGLVQMGRHGGDVDDGLGLVADVHGVGAEEFAHEAHVALDVDLEAVPHVLGRDGHDVVPLVQQAGAGDEDVGLAHARADLGEDGGRPRQVGDVGGVGVHFGVGEGGLERLLGLRQRAFGARRDHDVRGPGGREGFGDGIADALGATADDDGLARLRQMRLVGRDGGVGFGVDVFDEGVAEVGRHRLTGFGRGRRHDDDDDDDDGTGGFRGRATMCICGVEETTARAYI